MAKKIPQSVLMAIRKYVAVLKEDIPVQLVLLYGSYAKGTYNKDSDIDIAIFSKIFGKNPHEENVYLWSKLWEINENKIEPRAYSTKDFRSNDLSPLLYEIRNYGIEVKV